MRGLKFLHGYPHLSPASDIKTSEPAVPTTSGNGYYIPMNFKAGATAVNMQRYFATAIRQSARPISGETILEEN